MAQERSPSENRPRQERNISVVSVLDRTPDQLVKNLFSLGTENIKAIDAALREMEYGALEDMISENYFNGTDEMTRAALAHRIMDMKYATDQEVRKRIAYEIASAIVELGLQEV